MTAPEPVSDALTVARWAWPDLIWEPFRDSDVEVHRVDPKFGCIGAHFNATRAVDLAQIEALMVERGLGEAYAKALWGELVFNCGGADPDAKPWNNLIVVRTAPLSTVLRALAAVVRAEWEKK